MLELINIFYKLEQISCFMLFDVNLLDFLNHPGFGSYSKLFFVSLCHKDPEKSKVQEGNPKISVSLEDSQDTFSVSSSELKLQ